MAAAPGPSAPDAVADARVADGQGLARLLERFAGSTALTSCGWLSGSPGRERP